MASEATQSPPNLTLKTPPKEYPKNNLWAISDYNALCVSSKTLKEKKYNLVNLSFAYGLAKMSKVDTARFNFRYIGIKDFDVVIMAFGGFDIGQHAQKFLKLEAMPSECEEYFNEIINVYLKHICECAENYVALAIFVCNLLPPARKDDLRFVIITTPEETRIEWTRIFNDCIEKKCKEFGLPLINIYDMFVDDEGMMNSRDTDTGLNTNNVKPLTRWIAQNIP